MKTLTSILISLAIINFFLALSFLGGYKYYQYSNPIIPSSDTLYIYDTTTYYVDVDHYHYDIDTIFYPDSIIIPIDIDTLEILKDYFALYKYNRVWEDSLIYVSFYDIISQNRILQSSLLEYKILRPQTIITNTTTINNYASYFNISLTSDFTLEYPHLKATLITPSLSYGLGYMPKQKALTLSVGYNLFKLK